jgi:hypothetical protein
MVRRDQAVASSFEVGIILYSLIALTVFMITRIRYDRDWDRFYHVNYPGLMEHFDKLFDHYSTKTEETLDNLPSSLEEVYEELLKPFKSNLQSQVQVVHDPNLQMSLAVTLTKTMGIQEDPSKSIKRKLAESDLD